MPPIPSFSVQLACGLVTMNEIEKPFLFATGYASLP